MQRAKARRGREKPPWDSNSPPPGLTTDMQLSHKRYHLGIFGGSGTGKTTYAMRFLAHAPATCRFMFDPDGEFSECMGIPPARTTFELDAAIRSGFVAFDPSTMFPGRLEDAIEYFASLAFDASARIPGRKLFAVDELGLYMTGNTVPRPLKVLVQTGRRRGLDGVWMAQQPNELHNTVRAQLSEIVAFQITDETALEFLVKWGFNPDQVKTLAQYQYVCRTNKGGQLLSWDSDPR